MNAQTKVEAAPIPAVYEKIAAVQADLAKAGISKDRDNSQQNYKFRGIDDVYNALAPLLSKHGLCVLPRMLSRSREERVTIKEWNGQRKESVLFYVSVEAEFDFIAAVDGSCHVVRTFGEAMDSGDKATNKAMSAAYKYAAFMAFAIPTEGDNDADATTHHVEPKPAKVESAKPVKGAAHSALKTEVRQFVREMESCGDWDTWCAFRDSKDARRIVADVQEKLPSWWDGGDDLPAEFVPLRRRIEILEGNLANNIAEFARN